MTTATGYTIPSTWLGQLTRSAVNKLGTLNEDGSISGVPKVVYDAFEAKHNLDNSELSKKSVECVNGTYHWIEKANQTLEGQEKTSYYQVVRNILDNVFSNNATQATASDSVEETPEMTRSSSSMINARTLTIAFGLTTLLATALATYYMSSNDICSSNLKLMNETLGNATASNTALTEKVHTLNENLTVCEQNLKSTTSYMLGAFEFGDKLCKGVATKGLSIAKHCLNDQPAISYLREKIANATKFLNNTGN